MTPYFDHYGLRHLVERELVFVDFPRGVNVGVALNTTKLPWLVEIVVSHGWGAYPRIASVTIPIDQAHSTQNVWLPDLVERVFAELARCRLAAIRADA